MLKQYLVYAKTNPFPGYIKSHGKVRTDLPPDGSTMMERLEELPVEYGYVLLDKTVEIPDKETHKWDEVSQQFVPLETGDITPEKQVELDAQQKAQEIADRLPSWATVENAVNNISNLADAKAYLLKLSRVVYWLAKGRP